MMPSARSAFRPTALALRARRARSASVKRIRRPRSGSLERSVLSLKEFDDYRLMTPLTREGALDGGALSLFG
jgi:hypothetical protein